MAHTCVASARKKRPTDANCPFGNDWLRFRAGLPQGSRSGCHVGNGWSSVQATMPQGSFMGGWAEAGPGKLSRSAFCLAAHVQNNFRRL
eukprot:2676676-Alexandrium_andersonii.AAC.1